MLGSKHFTNSGLLHLGHRIPSDFINICLQGLFASNYELRRNSSIKSFSTKSEEVYSLRNLRYKCWTFVMQREKCILLDLMKQWCMYLHPCVLLLIKTQCPECPLRTFLSWVQSTWLLMVREEWKRGADIYWVDWWFDCSEPIGELSLALFWDEETKVLSLIWHQAHERDWAAVPLPTTQEKTLHMDIIRWSTPKSDWLYSLQPKMEKLYTVNKNKTRSWLWLRSWTPYCQIQT